MHIQDVMDTSGVRFGTSGARGLVADMTPDVCFAYTTAFLQVIAAPAGSRVALGMDLRPSSPEISAACAEAIRHAGMEVDFCGELPTPALAYYAQEQGIPAIMVTGSHIPFDRNGIKFYRPSGEISKEDETGIARAKVVMPAAIRLNPLPSPNLDAGRAYLDRYLEFFPANVLVGMKLGFYEHSSVARDLLKDLLEALGATVISLGRTDEFVPIDTEAVSQADIDQANHWSAEYGFDALLSTDGDADRPLIGDERGEWLRGDVVGILCAQYLGVRVVVTPVSSNTALEKCGGFEHIVRTRIGSPYVISAMENLAEQGATKIAGFEANGGFLLGSRLEKAGRSLEPLPTRDAVLPILVLLAMARERGVTVSRLPADLPPRFTASDRIQNIATEQSYRLIADLAGNSAYLEEFLSPFGKLADLDLTDGLRITLKDGDIIHLRPSGNSPELRCYAEAGTSEKASVLTKEVLAIVRTRVG